VNNDLRFDHSRARSLSRTLNECEESVVGIKKALIKEVDNAGQWWKGESYTSFKADFHKFKGVESTLNALSDDVAKVRNYLGKITGSKEEFEKKNAKRFK
jgi:uncharacterized protein YukE